MSEKAAEIEKQIDDLMEVARWQGEVSGKIEGALNVLFELELGKEERIKLLQRAVGLSHMTASEIYESRSRE